MTYKEALCNSLFARYVFFYEVISANDAALILLVCTCYIIFAFIEMRYALHQRDIASIRGHTPLWGA
jgi:hypothetical protein